MGISFPVHATDSLVTSLEKNYAHLKNWSADFTQTTFVEMVGQNLTKEGRIQVMRPNKIRIAYTTDPQKTYVTDGQKLWVYKESENSAWEFADSKRLLSEEALSFLSGLSNVGHLFQVMENLKEPEGYLKINDGNLKKIFLVPLNEESSILKITLGVDPKDFMVREAVLFNASGNVTHYDFKNMVFDTALDLGVFGLPKEPKRKVIKK
jgi:outer membrane lipoprotein-sorting protein